jgi:hypothetical protein
MQVKINLDLNSRQLSALQNGKNIQISPENIGGEMEFLVNDLKILNRINKAISKGKSTRVSANDLNMVDGGSSLMQRQMRRLKNSFSKKNMQGFKRVGDTLQAGLDKVIPREMQRKAKGKVLDKLDNYIDGMGTYGGSTLMQRQMRRLKNSFSKKNMQSMGRVGNELQAGLDKLIPREMQRKVKGKILDKLDNYVDGMGVSKSTQKRVRLPMSELQGGVDFTELPSGVLEPNNIKSLALHKKIHGSSFRGP